MKSRRLATCIAFAAMAVMGLATESTAAEKSWGEECRGKVEGERGRQDCCWFKMAKCSRECEDEHFGNENAQDDCRDDCKSDEAKCKKDVKASAGPNVSTSTRPHANQSIDERVCCRKGARHGWTQARDCQMPKGQVVEGRLCASPHPQTQTQSQPRSSSAPICCNANGAHSMMAPNECRARRGAPVEAKMCQGRKPAVENFGGQLLKSGPRN